MDVLFSLIALPITICVHIICFLFAMLFEESFRAKDGISVFKRVLKESNNLVLASWWDDKSLLFKGVVSSIIYYLLLA